MQLTIPCKNAQTPSDTHPHTQRKIVLDCGFFLSVQNLKVLNGLLKQLPSYFFKTHANKCQIKLHSRVTYTKKRDIHDKKLFFSAFKHITHYKCVSNFKMNQQKKKQKL